MVVSHERGAGLGVVEGRSGLVLRNKDGSPQKISWWNSLYLCPADTDVVAVQRKFVDKIIGEWGFDGLKLDGQYMNAVPACYNPAHHHAKPEDSIEQLPQLFKAIYDEAQKLKPGALVEFCPVRDFLFVLHHALLQHERGIAIRRVRGRCGRKERR